MMKSTKRLSAIFMMLAVILSSIGMGAAGLYGPITAFAAIGNPEKVDIPSGSTLTFNGKEQTGVESGCLAAIVFCGCSPCVTRRIL